MSFVDGLRGRINDVDSHEMIPGKLWGQCFGPIGDVLKEAYQGAKTRSAPEMFVDVDRDETPINHDSVWRRVGWGDESPRAPGAIDMGRRLEVLDFMGVNRQLIFPNFGIAGLVLTHSSPEFVAANVGVDPEIIPPPEVMRALGAEVFKAHNNWAIEQAQRDPDRLRMVATIPTADFDQMMTETERVLAGGIRALFIPASVPPGGKSPADAANEPFWRLCEEAGATVLLHLAFEEFLKTDQWRRIPEFETEAVLAGEFIIEPWSLATVRMVVENFVLTMILGGVFERHPNLRLGVIECSAQWVGPLAENMDMWAGVFKRRMAKILSQPPSAYLSSNVRVTPYCFERVASYINRYGFEDVYCYGSDYPHVEGGTDQLDKFLTELAPLGESVLEKFFVTNSEWIMPSLAPAASS